MSLLNPGADTKHLISQALNSKGLGTLSKEEGSPYLQQLTDAQYLQWRKDDLNFNLRPKEWTKADDDLVKLCYRVRYSDGTKSLSAYNSGFAQTKMRTKQIASVDEKTLLSGVTEIAENMDLSNTTLDSLGTIKKIGGSLYLDTASRSLKDASALKEIGGSVVVRGRDVAEVFDYLKKINFPLETLGKKVKTIIKYL